MINHGSNILHVFFFISSDYSITAVKSPPFPVVCIGPWINECAFNNIIIILMSDGKISMQPHHYYACIGNVWGVKRTILLTLILSDHARDIQYH